MSALLTNCADQSRTHGECCSELTAAADHEVLDRVKRIAESGDRGHNAASGRTGDGDR